MLIMLSVHVERMYKNNPIMHDYTRDHISPGALPHTPPTPSEAPQDT